MTQELEREIRGLIATGSGLSAMLVIEGNGKSPRPKQSYASVLMMDNERRGYPVFRDGEQEGDGTQTITPRMHSVSVQWYRDDAQDNALAFANWVESEIGVATAYYQGLSFQQPINFRRLDLPVGDEIERRIQADIVVHYVASRIQDTGWVSTLNGNLCYDEYDEVAIVPVSP